MVFSFWQKDNKKRLGAKGEGLAVKYLRKKGYRIIERNFRIKSGEIDVIARDGNVLVFVEVKTRTSDNQVFLRNSVNRGKAKRMTRTAMYYLQDDKYRNMSARFDVVFVVMNNGFYKVEIIKDAFRLDEI